MCANCSFVLFMRKQWILFYVINGLMQYFRVFSAGLNGVLSVYKLGTIVGMLCYL